ncbi:hypothetical protein QPL62_22010, partial [Klebsiella michiganensis]
MMNVDKSFPVLTPGFLKIESAALTDGTMIRDTGPPCGRVAFIRVDGDGFCGALNIATGDGQLFGIRGLTLSGTKTHVKQRFLPLTPLLMVS